MYVCVCNRVSDKAIRRAVEDGARTFIALQQLTGVGTCCGKCVGCAREVMLDEIEAQARREWDALDMLAAA
ncbi:(2Fe-2S)-binding protein [Chitiniphilus purpureus]|uniref:Bacterioferritin-associated ferredoxin n=1 Tax=Chitiniphilus purpureus TaxID=2981137 RepID=A0ABY6DJ41_9NEIS|nr:(2Fe-2S)-binding protein [Chitiniphilus sp. CD1]UXY14374.1 (2Fe-2S)-binding protein [Chitiniphilus sp. CD1]